VANDTTTEQNGVNGPEKTEIRGVHNGCTRVERAAKHWHAGEAMEAGRLLFETLPGHLRPIWGARILRLVISKNCVDDSSLFAQVLYDAEHERMWADGHRAFSTLRDSLLRLQQKEAAEGLTKEQTLLKSIVVLGELVAKVTYNAARPPDGFDEDSGCWIAASLKGFVDHARPAEQFSHEAWSALIWCGRGGTGGTP
jgi:hypothetical protein